MKGSTIRITFYGLLMSPLDINNVPQWLDSCDGHLVDKLIMLVNGDNFI